jgi:catechol 2,3-dioxygenase
MSRAIKQMGYVALQSTDLEFATRHARDILGLTETARSGNAVFLSSAARSHHELVYLDSPFDGVGHFGLVANGLSGLDSVRRRVKDAGFEVISQSPLLPGVSDGFSFRGPEGFVYEIYIEMEKASYAPVPHGPQRYGHINLHPTDPTAYKDFLVNILDFMVSDVIGQDFGYFLRCNSEHHGIALIKGRGWMHHHAWQAQSIAELGLLGDRLWESGARLLMGPVRHGESGRNIAAYYLEPTGNVVELYTDMRHIYDDDAPANIMSNETRDWATQWAFYDAEEFRAHGVFPAPEVIASS